MGNVTQVNCALTRIHQIETLSDVVNLIRGCVYSGVNVVEAAIYAGNVGLDVVDFGQVLLVESTPYVQDHDHDSHRDCKERETAPELWAFPIGRSHSIV